MKLPAPLIAALLCLPLLACGPRDDAATGATAADSGVVEKVRTHTDAARRKLATSNVSISRSGTPKAEISPEGDLLIEGKAVTIDASQRQMLLAYRQQIIEIANAGMDIGVQGAALGVGAAGEAIKGVFSGNMDEVQARIEAEAAKIEGEARKLCDLVPAMRRQQQALAAALPEFAPYARSSAGDAEDTEECMKDGGITVP